MVGENDAGSREREVVRRDLRRQVVGAQPVPDEEDHVPFGRCVRLLCAQVAGERKQDDGEGTEENKRSCFHGACPMTPAMTVCRDQVPWAVDSTRDFTIARSALRRASAGAVVSPRHYRSPGRSKG